MEVSGLVSNLKIVAELFLYIYCLAKLFGRKLKIGIHAVVFIILNLFIMAGINDFGFPEYFSSLGYIAMFLYSFLYYEKSIKETLVNCFLALAIMAILQLLLYLPLHYLFFGGYKNADFNGLFANIVGILLVMLCSKKIKLKRLSDFCLQRNKMIMVVAILIFGGLGINFYQIVEKRIIMSETYFQMVYFVLIFLFVIYEWQKTRMDAEKKKTQLEMNKLYYDAYDQLILLVRERQHDMKNHINAILSLIYTTEKYEELIEKQKEYCGYVIEQNEKTKLVLSSGNPLIAGFVYSKIREAESSHIIFDYRIGLRKETAIPEYELVDIAGILLDNAIEALHGTDEENFERKIYFSIGETEESIDLLCANTSPRYEEDLTDHFFESGYSSKGQNRGIGLAKLERLVQNRNGTITVYNEDRQNANYLTFEIKLPK